MCTNLSQTEQSQPYVSEEPEADSRIIRSKQAILNVIQEMRIHKDTIQNSPQYETDTVGKYVKLLKRINFVFY